MVTSPHVREQRLGQELRKSVLDAGLTAEQVAKKIRVSRVTISHLETAARRPDVGDVMDILDQLSVKPRKFDELVRVARDAAARGWWEERRYKAMGERKLCTPTWSTAPTASASTRRPHLRTAPDPRVHGGRETSTVKPPAQ